VLTFCATPKSAQEMCGVLKDAAKADGVPGAAHALAISQRGAHVVSG
jgi:hypothetical protein